MDVAHNSSQDVVVGKDDEDADDAVVRNWCKQCNVITIDGRVFVSSLFTSSCVVIIVIMSSRITLSRHNASMTLDCC